MFQFRLKKYRQCSDEELILLFKEKQDSAFIGILYERYSHLVMGVALKYLKNVEESQDITSKIFEELPSKLAKHSVDFFKSWLYRVTMNEAFQVLRKKGVEISTDQFPMLEMETSNQEEIQSKENQLEALEKAIEELKPEQKKCIQLFYLQEKSYAEIAQELNLELMKVKSYIQNGKRNIKLQLEELKEFKNER
jgi:RNA polymerase sigma-70 factor (ECF subfamily)